MFSGRVGAESENKGAVVVITNKPANVKRLLFGSGLVPDSLLELHSQCTSTSEFCLKGGIIRCFCENAYYGANGQGSECKQPSNNYTGGFHVDGGFFDLNGYDQRCGAFHSLSLENKTGYQQYTTHSSGSAAAQIHSPTPATFHVCNQLDFTTNATPFTGAASLALDGGSGLLVLANPSPTTGGLTVNSTSGTLELSSSATWPNASKVELLAGTLKLAAIERQLGRKAAWYVKDGKVEIPSGVTLKGGALWLYDGEKGVYVEQKGRSVYNAGNCDFVTGGGSLEVGKGGLILLFR